jgi:hypothetical protein
MVENVEDTLVIESMVKGECSETVAIVKESPHSRLFWQVNWSKLEPPRER